MSDADELAPPVSAEELAAAAELDAAIDGSTPEPVSPAPAPSKEAPADPGTKATSDEPAPERDYEAEARADGWTSLDEWVAAGKDPEKHRDAQTYVELADNDPASLRRKYTEVIKQNEEFQRKTAAATKAEIERVTKESERRHQAELASLKAERDDLINKYAGNPDAIRQINANFEQATQQVAQPLATEVATWFASHPEYDTDPVFQAAVTAKGEQIKHLPYAEQVKALDESMSRRFPEYYGNSDPKPEPKPSNGAPPANSRTIDGARTIQTRAAHSFDSLPKAAKDMYAMLKEEGIAPKKDDYAKDYHNG